MEKYIDLKKGINLNKINKVAECIKNGGIAIFPTETVYGIGANAFEENAIRRIYKIKQRSLTNPISLLVSDFSMIESVARDITDVEYEIMRTFFPGPLTIILNKRKKVPDIVTAGGQTVGIRMPDGDIARKLVELSGVPIATTSANVSNHPNGTNYESIISDFQRKIDYFIDSGESKIGIPSTVVKVVDGKPKILREGSISKEEIMNALI